MKKDAPKNKVCGSCGNIAEPNAVICSVCGGILEREKPKIKTKQKGGGVTCLTAILLGVFALLFNLSLFIFDVAKNMSSLLIGDLEYDTVFKATSSLLTLILVGVCVAGLLALLVYINIHYIRRLFSALGIVSVSLAAINLVLGLMANIISSVVSGAWGGFLTAAADPFKSYSYLSALTLVLIGATCFSVYASIFAVKKGDEDEN